MCVLDFQTCSWPDQSNSTSLAGWMSSYKHVLWFPSLSLPPVTGDSALSRCSAHQRSQNQGSPQPRCWTLGPAPPRSNSGAGRPSWPEQNQNQTQNQSARNHATRISHLNPRVQHKRHAHAKFRSLHAATAAAALDRVWPGACWSLRSGLRKRCTEAASPVLQAEQFGGAGPPPELPRKALDGSL